MILFIVEGEMRSVSVLGLGRLGRALAGLCEAKGYRVRAYDPWAEVPTRWAVQGLETLTQGSRFVLLAVPVPAMAEAVAALRPYLRPSHCVVDLGSVKVRPMEALRSGLGDEIPWVSVHPLFGPVSLAQGEPLKVVLCPNGLHTEHEVQAAEFWRDLGCEVFLQDAHAHDQDMAHTHALGFFVAKGLLEAEAGKGVAHPPPSFQAMARSVQLVRADAGHLFKVLQLENPYARDARKRLLAALQSVDRALDDEAAGLQGSGALEIVNGGEA